MVRCITFLFVFITFCLDAQDPYHILYGIEQGLPSEEIYDVYVDTNDVVWTTTDRGVSLYDGYSFSNYSTADGLAYNTNFKIIPDNRDRLWILGYDGSVSIFENGQFFKAPFSDTLQSLADQQYYYDLLFDEEGNHYLTYSGYPIKTFSDSYVKISKNEEITLIAFNSNGNENAGQDELILSKEAAGNQSIYRIEPYKYVPLKPIKIDTNTRLFFKPKWAGKLSHRPFSATLAKMDQLILYEDNKITVKFSTTKTINAIAKDRDGNIILCTNDGILIFRNGDLDSEPEYYFEGTQFSDFDMDKNGNYWISSPKDGLYFVPSFDSKIIPIETKEKQVKKLKIHENNLFFEYAKDFVNYLDTAYSQNRLLSGSNLFKSALIDDITKFTPSRKDGKYYMEDNYRPHYFMHSLAQLSNGDQFVLLSSQIVSQDSMQLSSSKGIFNSNKSRVKDMKSYKDDLYISTLRSFYLVRNGAFDQAVDLSEENKLLNVKINDFEFDHNGNRWIATGGNGILYHQNDNSTTQFNADNRLFSNLYNTLYFQNDTTLWAGSNSGLEKIIVSIQNETAEIKSVVKYNVQDGLLSNYIHDIIYWNDEIWVASKEGLQSFNDELKQNTLPPELSIEAIKVNETNYQISDVHTLAYNLNDISITYKAISYDHPKDELYRYKLNRNNSTGNWKSTNDRTASYTNLEPGDYSFFVAAKNKNNVWSDTQIVSFHIRPHFSSTWWFRLLCILTMVAIIYVIYSKRLQYIVNKNRRERALQNALLRTQIAELSTFKNQFNPHFIFNSLNSIQNFIFKKDIRQANSFLSKFSKLIRESLSLSDKKFVTIEKEFAFIDSYLKLEFLRFPDKFSYEFHNSEKVPLDMYFCPPLLLQPVIENVVKHAFKQLEYGKLDISLHQDDTGQGLIITIEDNGIGIKDIDPMHQKRERESFGLKIINDRIALLNIDYPEIDSSFTVLSKAISPGTIAKFVIPKITFDQIK